MNTTTNFGEWILGYDARVSGRKIDDRLKSNFLYRLDGAEVYSIDPMIWPSVFDACHLSKPSYTGFWPDLWDNLDALTKYLSPIKALQKIPFCIIGVELLYDICTIEEKREWDALLGGCASAGIQKTLKDNVSLASPCVREENWSFLGYDIADRYGLSGLTNCGFDPNIENVGELRLRWAVHLNEHHLFDDIDRAVEFKDWSNIRVREHAPFFVYGIWLISAKTDIAVADY
ncbi:hypothetical protein [Candidatus Thiosymbion oneisti]|uniref:hypothetical protein n=1 Tax=Candidatus Thiosymbion oneisti TaxID=589554 RepID=UPI00105CEB28|nr:hypothetical protein [Candidatus Thiosymbion oneisti]